MIQHSQRTTLSQWIAEALDDPEKDGPCTALSLCHCMAHSSGAIAQDEIHSVKIGEKGYDPNALEAMFKHKAQTYSQDLTGTQSFILLAFYGGRGVPEAKHPFRVDGATQFEGLATENPTPAGQQAQNMRLAEVIVQGSFKQNSITFDTLIRSHDALTRQNQQLIEQQWQAFEMVKSLIIERERENHEYRLKEANREMIAKMLSFVPPLANSILGQNVFPQETADSALIEALAENLTPEKLALLQAALPEKVWPLVAERLKGLLQEKAKLAASNGSSAKAELS